jgi:hypothetical protein
VSAEVEADAEHGRSVCEHGGIDRHLGFVFDSGMLGRTIQDEVVGLGAAKAVGCRKGATGGAEDEVDESSSVGTAGTSCVQTVW